MDTVKYLTDNFEAIYGNASLPVILFDNKANLLRANQAFLDLAGASVTEIKSLAMTSLFKNLKQAFERELIMDYQPDHIKPMATNVPTLMVNGGTVTNSDPAEPDGKVNNGLNNVVLNNGTLTSTTGNSLSIIGPSRPGEGYGAWGINGCASVTGSVLAIVLAMSQGFSFVWMLSVGIYAVGVAGLLATVRDGAAAG